MKQIHRMVNGTQRDILEFEMIKMKWNGKNNLDLSRPFDVFC